ncbi:glucosaminidase domain-containing protein [Bacteroides pyogenes]|uniref:glycoside hydrolase family 73 protein n=1 Tax=Bacteroides pyogenes TaxID=310300 RepID=UPI002A90AD53|nr:glucosaminidase domain-containing protein [Bacteroides pyogenes]MDY5433710.1 glucosaminidase domain-containing protein [Bacteroides pyogenes]
MNVRDFILWIYPKAKTGDIDPIFVTAQAALESGWGKSSIGNNIFGITKGSSWTGAVQLVTTTEYFSHPNVKFQQPEKIIQIIQISEHRYKYLVKRLFRDYECIEDCLSDHFALLQRPQFADAWAYRKNPELYVRKLVDGIGGKYATAPNYVDTMDRIFKMVRKVVQEENL